MSSFDRQLRRYNYGEYIATGPKFAQVREVLKSKQKELKRDGKGNLPKKSDPVSDKEVDIMWQSGQLGGSTPDSILQTLWFYNTVHFGLRGSTEHRDMCWGDVALKTDSNGHEYLEFTERQTKTRTGENPRDIRVVKPKLYANLENLDRCPVIIYKQYAQKRPNGYSDPSHPFYIASTTKPAPAESETWFKRNAVGINKLQSMMSRLVKGSKIITDKHLTNHSARKYLVQKLNDSNIPANHIMQISGHRNIASINNYSHINENQHKEISKILHSDRAVTNADDRDIAATYFHNPVVRCSNTQSHTNSSLQTQSTMNVHVPGGFQNLFGSQIHGGTFNIHVHQNIQNVSPELPNNGNRKRRHTTNVESDSDD